MQASDGQAGLAGLDSGLHNHVAKKQISRTAANAGSAQQLPARKATAEAKSAAGSATTAAAVSDVGAAVTELHAHLEVRQLYCNGIAPTHFVAEAVDLLF